MSDVREAPVAAETVFRLVYRSHSRIPEETENEELGRILTVSRANNAGCGVTGALMYYDRWFAQALEGSQQAVQALFNRIMLDARHDSVEVREQGAVPARVFGRWAMAHVGEHGEADVPMTAARGGVAEAAAWKPTSAQDAVLSVLRDLTRGYGIGA